MKSTIIPIYESDYSSDDNNNIHSDINPSCIIKNYDTNYETASDDTGYDENIDYKVISMRKPSFIRKTLTKFRKSVDEQTNFNSTMIGSTLIPISTPSFFQRLKKRIYIPIAISIGIILTGVILATA
jgi:hypothetical protein|uniref:Uncharacterized protein n=1 Tax=viral metagenome TaxID=1070528 RepID=A0A6C0CYH2_9ZZZZ